MEANVPLDGAQGVATAGAAKRTVLVVRRRVIPAAEALADGLLAVAGRPVVVREAHEVRGDGGLPCFLEAGAVEGARDEVSRNRVGGGRGLDGMERTA